MVVFLLDLWGGSLRNKGSELWLFPWQYCSRHWGGKTAGRAFLHALEDGGELRVQPWISEHTVSPVFCSLLASPNFWVLIRCSRSLIGSPGMPGVNEILTSCWVGLTAFFKKLATCSHVQICKCQLLTRNSLGIKSKQLAFSDLVAFLVLSIWSVNSG